MNVKKLANMTTYVKLGQRAWGAAKKIATRSGRRWAARIKGTIRRNYFKYGQVGAADYLLDKEYERGLSLAATARSNEIEGYKKRKGKSVSMSAKFEPNTIPYTEAKVFVLVNLPNYNSIIDNYKNRGFISRVFANTVIKLLDKELIKGTEILAFKSLSDLRESGLIPRSQKFYKILTKNGSFYLFSGLNFYFVYIVGNTNNLFRVIKSYFYSKIPSLSREEYKDEGPVVRIKEALGIKKISLIEKINKEKFEFVTFPTI